MAEESNIGRIVELQNSLPEHCREYLNRYLCNAPRWFWESVQILRRDKNSIFVQEGLDVDFVYILVEGVVKAIDYRIFGIAYDYMWFYPVKVFGSMEILLKINKYRTTLMTVTPCTLLAVSKSKFESWMMNDLQALHMEIESMGNYLLEQARKERAFLFLMGIDRVIYLFTQIYEQTLRDDQCVITLTRMELSERSGLSVKTITRCVKKMEQEGYIRRSGNKILISSQQYQIMKEYLSGILG